MNIDEIFGKLKAVRTALSEAKEVLNSGRILATGNQADIQAELRAIREENDALEEVVFAKLREAAGGEPEGPLDNERREPGEQVGVAPVLPAKEDGTDTHMTIPAGQTGSVTQTSGPTPPDSNAATQAPTGGGSPHPGMVNSEDLTGDDGDDAASGR